MKRYTARTSREALALVKSELGADAVVLSTRPGPEGVEVLAMAPEGMRQVERAAAQASVVRASAGPSSAANPAPVRAEPRPAVPRAAETDSVEHDVETLGMSTLTFQDYVRERMLKRRQEQIDQAAASRGEAGARPAAESARPAAAPKRDLPVLREEIRLPDPETQRTALAAARRDHTEVLGELRQVRALIEERFGTLAFMEKLHRSPRQAELAQVLLDAGLSPALIRKVVQALPADVADEMAWAIAVLERNLATDERESALEDAGGVYALIGSTGVGKTTSTAKIAAAFAAKHGAANLGLITLDAYRVAAHEQLRTYGRILGVPVHTAHDRASLDDLLELLAGKRMVLIDTAGMAQRDTRTRELLEMLAHPSIKRLLVVNAAAQGETVEDVMNAYGAASCHGVIVSKLDEAMKLGPALDGLIRHKCKVVGVANGQRVPEDWHRLSAQALVQRALRSTGSASWRLDADEVSLVFAGRAQTPAATMHA